MSGPICVFNTSKRSRERDIYSKGEVDIEKAVYIEIYIYRERERDECGFRRKMTSGPYIININKFIIYAPLINLYMLYQLFYF